MPLVDSVSDPTYRLTAYVRVALSSKIHANRAVSPILDRETKFDTCRTILFDIALGVQCLAPAEFVLEPSSAMLAHWGLDLAVLTGLKLDPVRAQKRYALERQAIKLKNLSRLRA